ncbi:MAG: DNA polymerase III subunit beta [Candidatus Yanofskybacteria bacterium]|nr:DNA polymerase III subunit beta [Candidatus Yanofskybacteria bacterium]
MRITINQKNLLKATTTVERVVSRNPSLPILNNILLKTENGRLKISATNLEIGINYYIGAKIDETGEIAVPARIFSDFIGNLGEEKITLVTKNNILSLNTNKYKTQILGLDPKDFPIIPKIKGDNFSVIPSKVLKNSLTAVFDSVAVSETRPELSGVYMNFSSNHLTFAATDSFRLTEKVNELKHKEKEALIIPRGTVVELIRLASDIQEDITIKLGDNQMAFVTDDIEVVSRIIDGNYPDYKKVIPDKFISRVVTKKDELEKNVRLAGLFSSSIADIKLNCDDKKISLTAKNSDKGDIQVSVDAVLKNDPFDISINHHYLLDGLKIIPTENVVIEYTGHGSPVVLRPEQDSKDLVYLIMPLRN